MIFVTFIEILMPDNSMKKYTKIILGFLIMIIILNPILIFLKKDFSLSAYSFNYENKLESLYIKNQSKDFSKKQSEAMTKLYKQNVEIQMEKQISKTIDENDIKVEVDINEDINSEDLENYLPDLELNIEDFNECFSSGKYYNKVKENYGEGEGKSIEGTPTFFVNGIEIKGAQPYETFSDTIETAIKSK